MNSKALSLTLKLQQSHPNGEVIVGAVHEYKPGHYVIAPDETFRSGAPPLSRSALWFVSKDNIGAIEYYDVANGMAVLVLTPNLLTLRPGNAPQSARHSTLTESSAVGQSWEWSGCELQHGSSGWCDGNGYWILDPHQECYRHTYGPYVPVSAGNCFAFFEVHIAGSSPRGLLRMIPAIYVDVVIGVGGRRLWHGEMTWNQFDQHQSDGWYRGAVNCSFTLPFDVTDLEIRTYINTSLDYAAVLLLKLVRL